MVEIDLLVFGCAVMFIAAAGAYVFARERFVYSDDPSKVRAARRSKERRERAQKALAEREAPRPAA
jgi:hypothetical protein